MPWAPVLPFPCDPKDWGKLWRDGRWNEIRARIQRNPPEIDVWLGGAHLTRFVDREMRLPEKGHLGIQVHGGKGWPAGATVRYRKIQVSEISR